jgi:hypothetical protein
MPLVATAWLLAEDVLQLWNSNIELAKSLTDLIRTQRYEKVAALVL